MTQTGNGLAEPIRDALNVVIKNGKYAEVLKRWGLENEAVLDRMADRLADDISGRRASASGMFRSIGARGDHFFAVKASVWMSPG